MTGSLEKQIKAARKKLWATGDLSWKLKTHQRKMYDFLTSKKDKILVLNSSRRAGKTTVLLIIASELCIKNPKTIVKLVQPQQNMIRKNVIPNWNTIYEDCPDTLRPKFNKQDNIYEFPNGSQIQLAGSDAGNIESLRGGSAHYCIIDEAGFCDDLYNVINSVILPTTTLTRGQIVLSSTTPPDTTHPFIEYMRQAGVDERLHVTTIHDIVKDSMEDEEPLMTPDIYEEILSGYPKREKAEAFQIEYECKILHKTESTVIPEFDEDAQKDCVVEWRRPDFCDKYVAMDIGFVDFTFVIFAFYDFQAGTVVIEDELVVNGPEMTTDVLAELIKTKEKALWFNKRTGEYETPTLRVSDNNLMVINDLIRLHELNFIPTQKDNRETQINALRMMISSRQIAIHPRCKLLVEHLKNATWDKARKDFRRSEAYGHFDGVMALVYLLRNIDLNRNPFPKGYKYWGISPDHLFVNEYVDSQNKTLEQWGKTSLMPKKSAWRK